jgi:hypothetical protein
VIVAVIGLHQAPHTREPAAGVQAGDIGPLRISPRKRHNTPVIRLNPKQLDNGAIVDRPATFAFPIDDAAFALLFDKLLVHHPDGVV